LSAWDTASATSLYAIFYGASEMNADLSGWKVGKVITLQNTFNSAVKFTGTGLALWNTASATSLQNTFYKAGEMNSDLSAWKVGKVTTLQSMFQHASKFAGVGLDSWDTASVTTLYHTFHEAREMNSDLSPWNVAKVTNMGNTFTATSLTTCNKRLIADAWKSSSVFVATTYDTDWAADACPCTAGSTWSATGNTPCEACAAEVTCADGVKTSCATTTDTVCDVPCVAGSTWSVSGYAPCTSCSANTTCAAAGVEIACSPGSDIVCNGAVAPCVGGISFSASGKVPCITCTADSTCAAGVETDCTTTTDTLCKTQATSPSPAPAPFPDKVPCAAGSTWSTTGNDPCTTCTADSTCTTGVKTTCTTTVDTLCMVRTNILDDSLWVAYEAETPHNTTPSK
jgi:surface protein